MVGVNLEDFDPSKLTGRNRRLLNEWQRIERRMSHLSDISYVVSKRNHEGLPVGYVVRYDIRSICGVQSVERLNEPGVVNAPMFAERFVMEIIIPQNYPCIDSPAEFRFWTMDERGEPIAHPWHPNIRFFGEFAGRVCLNMVDSYTDLVWCVERVALYLSYELYHAVSEPPYPEDLKVAQWVVRQGEPNGWLAF